MPRLAPVLVLAALVLAGCVRVPGPTGSLGAVALPERLCAPACDALASTGAGFANEPSVAVNPTDPQNVVVGAHEYGTTINDVWPGVHVSRDGGATWTHGLIPGYPGDLSGPSALTGYQVGGDAALAFGPDGALYYAGIAFHRQLYNVALFVARSDDGGETWPQITIVQRGASTVVFNDKEYLAVDPATGHVHLAWTVFRYLPTTFAGVPFDPIGAGDIHYSRSEDKGATWSAPVKISTVPLNQGAIPVVAPDGRVHVAWESFPDDSEAEGTIVVATSSDNGDTWSAPIAVSELDVLASPLRNTNFRVNSLPAFAVDASAGERRGTLYVAWADESAGHADILASRSADGGVTWSAPVRVNDDATETDQWMPWMGVDALGRVHVVYLDRSEDPENVAYHARLATSLDGGATWTSVRLSEGASDDRVARPVDALGNEGATFIGDYSGLATSGDRVYAVWPDLRASKDGERHVDVFIASVR